MDPAHQTRLRGISVIRSDRLDNAIHPDGWPRPSRGVGVSGSADGVGKDRALKKWRGKARAPYSGRQRPDFQHIKKFHNIYYANFRLADEAPYSVLPGLIATRHLAPPRNDFRHGTL